jgi:UDP-N-acetylmuramyl pentapeptide synthase
MLTLADVIEGLTGYRWDKAESKAISQVIIDSRQAVPDSVFVALPGERVDGHDYVADALDEPQTPNVGLWIPPSYQVSNTKYQMSVSIWQNLSVSV